MALLYIYIHKTLQFFDRPANFIKIFTQGLVVYYVNITYINHNNLLVHFFYTEVGYLQNLWHFNQNEFDYNII